MCAAPVRGYSFYGGGSVAGHASDVLKADRAATADACASQCGGADGCLTWTWKAGRCTLLSTRFLGATPDPAAVSGTCSPAFVGEEQCGARP